MKWSWKNSMRGSVVGPVVQAGAVHGNVYLNTQDAAHEADPVLIVTTTVSEVAYLPPSFGGHGHHRAVQIEILVQTRSTQAVVLHDLRPALIRHLPPEHRLFRYAAPASVVEVRGMYVNLDDSTPQPRILHGPGFPFKVTAADPEMFRVTLGSDSADAVTLELAWTCAGRSGITTIDQDGSPFSVGSVYGIAMKLTFGEALHLYREQGRHDDADHVQRLLDDANRLQRQLDTPDHNDDQPPQNTGTVN